MTASDIRVEKRQKTGEKLQHISAHYQRVGQNDPADED